MTLTINSFQIFYSDGHGSFVKHLEGARDLIRHRGGRKQNGLTRFFSSLCISTFLFSKAPLLLESDLVAGDTEEDKITLKLMQELSILSIQRSDHAWITALELSVKLRDWLGSCPQGLLGRQMWRTKLRMCSCVIYLHPMLELTSQHYQDVNNAVQEILAIAEKIPEGHSSEDGLYLGLFMAGVTVFNDYTQEGFIRRRMKSNSRCIFVCIPIPFHSLF